MTGTGIGIPRLVNCAVFARGSPAFGMGVVCHLGSIMKSCSRRHYPIILSYACTLRDLRRGADEVYTSK
jgi:hypothetical protein